VAFSIRSSVIRESKALTLTSVSRATIPIGELGFKMARLESQPRVVVVHDGRLNYRISISISEYRIPKMAEVKIWESLCIYLNTGFFLFLSFSIALRESGDAGH
jgi:hypothetical protein